MISAILIFENSKLLLHTVCSILTRPRHMLSKDKAKGVLHVVIRKLQAICFRCLIQTIQYNNFYIRNFVLKIIHSPRRGVCRGETWQTGALKKTE